MKGSHSTVWKLKCEKIKTKSDLVQENIKSKSDLVQERRARILFALQWESLRFYLRILKYTR